MNEQPIECRAAVEIPSGAKNELLFLPIGLHAITPVAGGIGRPIKVKVDAASADTIEQQRAILSGKRKRPYFDFNHNDDQASFWPERFFWREGEGVIAAGEWTARGRRAVEGKDYRAFSPVFHVDNKRGDPATVVCKELADPNMGGLVNNPAFNNLAVWSKNAGVTALSQQQPNGENEMNAEENATLRAKIKELEDKIADKEAEGKDNDPEAIAAKSEKRSLELEIENADLKERDKSKTEVIMKQREKDADETIKAAIQRGALYPRDIPGHKRWKQRIMADPTMIEDLKSLVPHGNAISTPVVSGQSSAVRVTTEDPSRVFGKLAGILSTSAHTHQFEGRKQLSREFAAIFAEELQGPNKERMLSFPVSEFETAIQAADVTDASLATLSGSLVTQRTLELLKLTFPPLAMFTTDFSDQPAQFNQTIITRTINIPSVTDYNTSTGWAASTATTTDVPITITKHKGVNIVFHEQLLASTVRRLFDEFAQASAYALGKQLVDDLYVNITDANFTNNTVKATASFSGSDVIDVGTQLDLRGVPLLSRTMLLYPTVFGKLKQDARLTNPAIYVYPELLTTSRNETKMVIPVDSFQVCTAPNLPTNNGNVTGFAGSRSALVIATRMPNDYTTAMTGSSYGSVQMITEPDIGISVMQTQFVDHKLANATFRISLMYGTAAGQGNAGQLIKAAAGSGSSRA